MSKRNHILGFISHPFHRAVAAARPSPFIECAITNDTIALHHNRKKNKQRDRQSSSMGKMTMKDMHVEGRGREKKKKKRTQASLSS